VLWNSSFLQRLHGKSGRTAWDQISWIVRAIGASGATHQLQTLGLGEGPIAQQCQQAVYRRTA
jgi:hypothetical protein